MILMKVAREQYKHHPDNYMDIIGYGVCGLRVAEDAPTPQAHDIGST